MGVKNTKVSRPHPSQGRGVISISCFLKMEDKVWTAFVKVRVACPLFRLKHMPCGAYQRSGAGEWEGGGGVRERYVEGVNHKRGAGVGHWGGKRGLTANYR